MSAAQTTGSSPTGRHRWWVPRCTTASPGPRTTAGWSGRESSSRPESTTSTSMVAVVCHPASPGSNPGGCSTVRKQIPPPRGSSSHAPSGSPPWSGAPSAPPVCHSSTSAVPPPPIEDGRRAVGERVRATVSSSVAGHESARPVRRPCSSPAAAAQPAAARRDRGAACTRRTCTGRRRPRASGGGCRAGSRRHPPRARARRRRDRATMRPSTTTMKSSVSVACMPGSSGSSPSTRIQSPPPSRAPGKRMMRTEQPPTGGSSRMAPSGSSPPSSTVAGGPSSHNHVATANPLARIVFGGAPSETDHRPTLGVVPGDDPSCSELVVCGCHAADPTQPFVGAPEDPGATSGAWQGASPEGGQPVVAPTAVPLVLEQPEHQAGDEVCAGVEHGGVEPEHVAAARSRHVSLISSASSDPWVQ